MKNDSAAVRYDFIQSGSWTSTLLRYFTKKSWIFTRYFVAQEDSIPPAKARQRMRGAFGPNDK